MSVTGILDTDREILRYVEDERLLKVCSINKRMWNTVCDDAFLRRRLNKYPEIEKYRKEETLKTFFAKVAYYITKLQENFQFEYIVGDFEKYYEILQRYKGRSVLTIRKILCDLQTSAVSRYKTSNLVFMSGDG